jgi:hypothetical protein
MSEALFRSQFPALVTNPGVVYLDSASTTQKPRAVIQAVNAYLTEGAASPGRGAHPWSTLAERTVGQVRDKLTIPAVPPTAARPPQLHCTVKQPVQWSCPAGKD